ncbi:phytochelatin synthase family protein [Rhodospirillaceae bacterium SYSU D60014]|uniref:phytochelatin synthase family protein n=1 Tax=Virgifigura deserti TaxID=2268457 RepID=UPI000E66EAFB
MRARYASWLTLLATDSDYLRRALAPSYWALVPYYVGQFNDCSCSLATATMLVNALRGSIGLAPVERLVTQQALLAAVNSALWTAGVGADGGEGVTQRQMGPLLERSFAVYGVDGVAIETVPVLRPNEAAVAEFRAALRRIETSAADLLVVNFHVAPVVGHGDYGHFSPIGAYDEGRDRVLVLDVDRAWFEPYWTPVDRLVAGMATMSHIDGERRGYLRITRSL